jgi:hypothetical protein
MPTPTTTFSALARIILTTSTAAPVNLTLSEDTTLAAAPAAAVGTATAMTAALSAPAASQTLRSVSVLGIIETNERCRLQSTRSTRNDDTYPTLPRQFPESLLPWIAIAGGDADLDRRFGLASRRGAIVANALVAPALLLFATLLVGFARTRLQESQRGRSVLAAGRVPGVVGSVIASLALDGVFAAAACLLALPGGPSGGDAALAVFGALAATAVSVAPGLLLVRAARIARDELHDQLECVPAALITRDDATATQPVAGVLALLFGTEAWDGDADTLDAYRSLFGTSRGFGPSVAHENSGAGSSSATQRAWRGAATFAVGAPPPPPPTKAEAALKRGRRVLAPWSLYVDCGFTVLAAITRGWATAQPCAADGKVQVMQFCIAVAALIFSIVVQAPLSPVHRGVDLVCGFLTVLATFALVVLSSEAGPLVAKCALAAALMSSTVSLALFGARRLVVPILGYDIVPAAARCGRRPTAVPPPMPAS